MASGGGKKPRKWKKMNVSAALPNATVRATTSWADEVEHELSDKLINVVLPTAPRAACDIVLDDSKIPPDGPFTAYLSNLPFEISVEDVTNHLKDLEVIKVDLPKDSRYERMKGYGYVQLKDKSSLITALQLREVLIKGRMVAISLPNEEDREKDKGSTRPSNSLFGKNRGYDNVDGPDKTLGEWRAGVPVALDESKPGFSRNQSRRESNPPHDFASNFRESRFDRDSDRDRQGGSSVFSTRTYQNRDRDGGSSGRRPFQRFDRDERNGPFDNKGGGGIFGRRTGGGGGFRDDFRRDTRASSENLEQTDELPKTRTKLQIKPRSTNVEPAAPQASLPSSIFGAAKPVDTSQRYLEMEEKLSRDLEPPIRGRSGRETSNTSRSPSRSSRHNSNTRKDAGNTTEIHKISFRDAVTKTDHAHDSDKQHADQQPPNYESVQSNNVESDDESVPDLCANEDEFHPKRPKTPPVKKIEVNPVGHEFIIGIPIPIPYQEIQLKRRFNEGVKHLPPPEFKPENKTSREPFHASISPQAAPQHIVPYPPAQVIQVAPLLAESYPPMPHMTPHPQIAQAVIPPPFVPEHEFKKPYQPIPVQDRLFKVSTSELKPSAKEFKPQSRVEFKPPPVNQEIKPSPAPKENAWVARQRNAVPVVTTVPTTVADVVLDSTAGNIAGTSNDKSADLDFESSPHVISDTTVTIGEEKINVEVVNNEEQVNKTDEAVHKDTSNGPENEEFDQQQQEGNFNTFRGRQYNNRYRSNNYRGQYRDGGFNRNRYNRSENSNDHDDRSSRQNRFPDRGRGGGGRMPSRNYENNQDVQQSNRYDHRRSEDNDSQSFTRNNDDKNNNSNTRPPYRNENSYRNNRNDNNNYYPKRSSENYSVRTENNQNRAENYESHKNENNNNYQNRGERNRVYPNSFQNRGGERGENYRGRNYSNRDGGSNRTSHFERGSRPPRTGGYKSRYDSQTERSSANIDNDNNNATAVNENKNHPDDRSTVGNENSVSVAVEIKENGGGKEHDELLKIETQQSVACNNNENQQTDTDSKSEQMETVKAKKNKKKKRSVAQSNDGNVTVEPASSPVKKKDDEVFIVSANKKKNKKPSEEVRPSKDEPQSEKLSSKGITKKQPTIEKKKISRDGKQDAPPISKSKEEKRGVSNRYEALSSLDAD